MLVLDRAAAPTLGYYWPFRLVKNAFVTHGGTETCHVINSLRPYRADSRWDACTQVHSAGHLPKSLATYRVPTKSSYEGTHAISGLGIIKYALVM